MAEESSNQALEIDHKEADYRRVVTFGKEDQGDSEKAESKELVSQLVKLNVRDKGYTSIVPVQENKKPQGKDIHVPVKQVKSHVPTGRSSLSKSQLSECQEGKPLKKSASSQLSRPISNTDFPTYGRGKDPPSEVNGMFMDKKVNPASSVQRVDATIYKRKFEDYKTNKQPKGLQKHLSDAGLPSSSSKDIQQLKSIFKKLGRNSQGVVTTMQVWSYLHDNPDVSDMLKLTELTISEDFVDYIKEGLGDTEPNDSFELDDFLGLYRRATNLSKTKRVKVKRHRVISKPVDEPKENPSQIALSPLLSQIIFDLFSSLDSYSEQYITREDFLNALSKNSEIQSNLTTVAIHLPTGDKTLGDILQVIEDEGDVKEYITLSELKTYLNFNYVSAQEEEANESALNEIELAKDDIRVLYNVFLSLPSDTENATRTKEFVLKIKEEPQYAELRAKKAREPKGLSKYPNETVEQLLARIETSEGDSLTWNVLLAYLTRRGEPLKLGQEEEEEEQESYYEEVSIKESEPSLHQSDTMTDSLSQETKPTHQVNAKFTIPNPFSFESRKRPKTIRQRKLEEMLEEYSMKEMEEMNKRFRAREVPSFVRKPKYESILQLNEERRENNRQKTYDEEQKLSKPFSFASKGIHKPSIEEPQQQPAFKANPVPIASQVLKLDQVEANELERKVRIAQRAEEELSKAALPPRMQAHQESEQSQPASISQNFTFRARSLPNFPALQEGFQQQLVSTKPPAKQTVPKPFNLSGSKPLRTPATDKKPIPSSAAKPSINLKDYKATKAHNKRVEEVKKVAIRVEYEGVVDLNQRTSRLKSAIEDIWEGF